MLSDSDSDSGVIPLDERNHGRRRNNNEDVIVLSDDNATGDEEPIVVEDNFVRVCRISFLRFHSKTYA